MSDRDYTQGLVGHAAWSFIASATALVLISPGLSMPNIRETAFSLAFYAITFLLITADVRGDKLNRPLRVLAAVTAAAPALLLLSTIFFVHLKIEDARPMTLWTSETLLLLSALILP